jgi:hypothetical protein
MDPKISIEFDGNSNFRIEIPGESPGSWVRGKCIARIDKRGKLAIELYQDKTDNDRYTTEDADLFADLMTKGTR